MADTTDAFDIFRLMAESVAGEIGHDFLSKLVTALTRHLDATFAAITYGIGDPPHKAHAMLALENGAAIDEFTYKLEGTPCRRVYEGETLVIPGGLAALYPREKGYESYIGVPLRGISGKVSGHLTVLGKHAISTDPDAALSIMRIFGQRVEAELRRMAYESEREALITELSELNARMQNGYQKTRQENDLKTRLMGIIAHDLRNPLAAIISQSELGQSLAAQNAPNVERLASLLSKIESNAERISNLINATLERVRTEQSTLPLARRPVALRALIGIATTANQPEAERKSIKMIVADTGALTVAVDDSLLISAIDNLVSNAIKYTAPGGSVTIGCESTEDVLTICVGDTGQGLSRSDLDRVFGRFQLLSAKPTGGESATGLGLYNVREIVEAHGGRVTAQSEGPGKGSRFCIHLPASPTDNT